MQKSCQGKNANFLTFLKKNNYHQTFNKKSLGEIAIFYKEHKKLFDDYKIKTLDFKGGETKHCYTKAKLIDMCGFEYGVKNSK